MSVVQEVLEMLGCESEMDAYRKKYLSLKMRCEQMQQANEKLVNRLYHIKKLTKQYKKERRALMARLEEHGDKYQDAMVPAQWDESQIYYMLAGRRPEGEGSPTEGASGGPSRARRPPRKSAQPKKPVDAFAIFCQQMQAAVVQQYYLENNNDISDEELSRRLNHQWSLLPPEDKQVYQELFRKQMEAESGAAASTLDEEEEDAGLHGDDPEEEEDVQI